MFEAHRPWMLMMFLSTFSFPTPEDAGIKKRVQRVFTHARQTHTHTHQTHTSKGSCAIYLSSVSVECFFTVSFNKSFIAPFKSVMGQD